MNPGQFSQLLGYVPGAAVGILIGSILGAIWFDSSTAVCRVGTSDIAVKCVQAPVGEYTSVVEFAVIMGIVGGLVGVPVAALHKWWTNKAGNAGT